MIKDAVQGYIESLKTYGEPFPASVEAHVDRVKAASIGLHASVQPGGAEPSSRWVRKPSTSSPTVFPVAMSLKAQHTPVMSVQ